MPITDPSTRPTSGSGRAVALRIPFSVTHRLAPAEAAAVQGLVDAVATAGGHAPIDRERLLHVLDGTAAGYLAALAWGPAHDSLVGYAQAVRGSDGWDVELVLAPPDDGERAGQAGAGERPLRWQQVLQERMLKALLHALAAEDDASLRLWRYQATEQDDRLAAQAGLSPTREIRQMRRALPLPAALAARDDDGTRQAVETRPFVPGRDEDAWLEANNRAFAWHPEQGGWTRESLEAREREPWFDPEGFLLHEVEDRLAGFCWTKVHQDVQPPLGEVYVVAVDPAFHGRALGRALVVAGLDHLARAGLAVGMLYVEATNAPAIGLYENLGFEVHHVDRVYQQP